MPTSGDDRGERWACDTSVAVAYLDGGHAAHQMSVEVVGARRPALAGHAAFETFSVLTRLPGSMQVAGSAAAEALASAFPEPCWLDPDEQRDLLVRLGPVGIRGGAVYDALVGEAARLRERILLTRDRRATRTYDLIGVSYEIV